MAPGSENSRELFAGYYQLAAEYRLSILECRASRRHLHETRRQFRELVVECRADLENRKAHLRRLLIAPALPGCI